MLSRAALVSGGVFPPGAAARPSPCGRVAATASCSRSPPRMEINAVLDWEMSTLGDPLSDVALMLVYASR
ncbi:hypothetical protein AB0C29_23665, partial [Actinoplanes sp. NPDC048791]